jgi:hypothetical protein
MNWRRRIVTLLPLLLTTLLTLSAFGNQETNDCFEYETDVKLTGTIKRETFPGPPEWESVEKGDEPLIYWILHLDKPICMSQRKQDDLIDVAERGIDRTQINVANLKGMYKNYQHLLNKRVKVTGTLYHQHSPYHVTTVVMMAKKFELSP